MAQEFQQPQETDSELRTQRMTAAESRAVIDLWQQEQTELIGLTNKPAVPDVAEGLDITVEDVQRLLQVVRIRRQDASRLLAQEKELTEIRLAEEERQSAEARRQQAERHREGAEAKRRHQTTYSLQAMPSTQPLHYTKEQVRSAGYKIGGLALCVAALSFFGSTSVPPPVQATNAITISHESAIYNAQGKVKSVNMTCTDSTGHMVTCGNDLISSEKQYLQDGHDTQIARAKALKKNYDKQTDR